MIRVVNLMIGLPSTINLHRKRWTSYAPDGGPSDSHLQMKMWIGWPLSGLQFFFQNIICMGCHPVHIFGWHPIRFIF